MKGRPHRPHLLGPLIAGSLLLAACGGGDEQTAGGAAPPPAPAATGAEGTQVTASLTDFAIQLSSSEFAPGVYTFVTRQAGSAPHALSIDGPGVDTFSTKVIAPGGSDETLAATLQAGTYELWCPVGSHREQGMETTITVG